MMHTTDVLLGQNLPPVIRFTDSRNVHIPAGHR